MDGYIGTDSFESVPFFLFVELLIRNQDIEIKKKMWYHTYE
jgi:hypothetical protein